jgi:hypothetical protein
VRACADLVDFLLPSRIRKVDGFWRDFCKKGEKTKFANGVGSTGKNVSGGNASPCGGWLEGVLAALGQEAKGIA